MKEKMYCVNIFLIYFFLTLWKAEGKIEEKGDTHDILSATTTSFPIVLELTESKESNENKFLHSTSEKTTEVSKSQVVNNKISNDIEVFEKNLGPQKARQEEEPAEEEEVQPEAEEPKEEEIEAEPAEETEPVAETESVAETEPVAEEGNEPASQPEEPNGEDSPAEPLEEEKENIKPDDVGTGDAAGNEESQMPNDEPAKEEETTTKQDGTKSVVTKDTVKNQVSCFMCNSNEDPKCPIKGTKQVSCPKQKADDEGKHNGCFTLYQADTNITMRGCVDELAEDGLKLCLKNEKVCNLCYSNGCNHKVAANEGTNLQLDIYSLLIFTIFSVNINKFASFTF